jgi:hypothetical protein
MNIQINGKAVEAAIDLSTKDSFVSETFANSLMRSTLKVASHKGTNQSRSAPKLDASKPIVVNVSSDNTSLKNESLYISTGRLGHKAVIGSGLWQALTSRASGNGLAAPTLRNDGQNLNYSREYSQLPQAVASLSLGNTEALTTPLSYDEPAQGAYSQEAYSQGDIYGSGIEQSMTDSQWNQPAMYRYQTLDPQLSRQVYSSYPGSSGYTTSTQQDFHAYPDYSNYTAQGSRAPYTLSEASYGSDSVPQASDPAPSTSYASSYVGSEYHDPGSDYYTHQSDLARPLSKESYQSLRQSVQETSSDTASPNETFYVQPEPTAARPEKHYAVARK